MSVPVIQARHAAETISGARAARVEVNKAVARGELPHVSTQTCVDCGEAASAYDHRDYGLPLQVQPVCDSCNAKRGHAAPNQETMEKYRDAILEQEINWKSGLATPVLLPDDLIEKCTSYRHAVRLAWSLRTRQKLTRATLAEYIGAYPSHVTDFFHEDDGERRRNLPSELINDFEWAVGNRAVTQYLLRKTGLALSAEALRILERAPRLTGVACEA